MLAVRDGSDSVVVTLKLCNEQQTVERESPVPGVLGCRVAALLSTPLEVHDFARGGRRWTTLVGDTLARQHSWYCQPPHPWVRVHIERSDGRVEGLWNAPSSRTRWTYSRTVKLGANHRHRLCCMSRSSHTGWRT